MSKTAKIPTIVLGGSGYVAGEFLRLIAGHAGAHARRCRVHEPSRRACGEDLPAPRADLRRHAVRLARRRHRTAQHGAALAAAVGRAARRIGRPRRPLADGGRERRHRARRRRRIGRLPFRRSGRVCRRLRPPARDAGTAQGVHLRRAGTARAHRDTARSASRLLRDDDAAAYRAARSVRVGRRVLRQRGDGQHGRRPYAARYHAPSAAGRAICSRIRR